MPEGGPRHGASWRRAVVDRGARPGREAVPGSRMHAMVSTLTGAAYAATAWNVGTMPVSTCLLAGGMCAAAGLLPDLDNHEGETLGESVGFAA